MKPIHIILKPKRENSIHRLHPWVFSGAIAKIVLEENQEAPKEGDWVSVFDSKSNFLAAGHFSEGSIAVRILSYEQLEPDEAFWIKKIQAAIDLRKSLALLDAKETNAFRLIHAEGDACPGLIIDLYNGVGVIQVHTLGMAKMAELICSALVKTIEIKAVYLKTTAQQKVDIEEKYLWKSAEFQPNLEHKILENNNAYFVDWVNGQKTGFFLDQRDNRALLGTFSSNKKVLNTFCYSGGFSVAALANNAKLVHSVDSSSAAIELTNNNIELNHPKQINKHKGFVKDCMQFLQEMEEDYDLIVLDPPAYAKSKSALHNAIQAYKRLNATAIKKIKSNGILFTFSCSQVVDRELFTNTIRAAGILAKREIQILHYLSQPADHPCSLFHPEGNYLKGLVLRIK